jgi:hypothetical protein
MNSRSKIRRQSWKPRTKFALKAKPRSTRGISRKDGHKQLSLGYAATGRRHRKAGRRVKPKRETPRVIHSERSGGKHKRVRLHGAARDKRRAEVFERAGGRCEEQLTSHALSSPGHWAVITSRCPNRATEWSHMRHGSNKCDCLDPRCNIASCHECHVRRHAGGNGKPCPKKENAA